MENIQRGEEVHSPLDSPLSNNYWWLFTGKLMILQWLSKLNWNVRRCVRVCINAALTFHPSCFEARLGKHNKWWNSLIWFIQYVQYSFPLSELCICLLWAGHKSVCFSKIYIMRLINLFWAVNIHSVFWFYHNKYVVNRYCSAV